MLNLELIRKILREARQRQGLTQDALATKAQTNREHVCAVETGSRPVGLIPIARLAKALGIAFTITLDGHRVN